jgi:hypothetical protein
MIIYVFQYFTRQTGVVAWLPNVLTNVFINFLVITDIFNNFPEEILEHTTFFEHLKHCFEISWYGKKNGSIGQ